MNGCQPQPAPTVTILRPHFTGSSLLMLLDQMLGHYETGGAAIYLHCWGGRGRAGKLGYESIRAQTTHKIVFEPI